MSGLVDTIENEVLDLLFGGQAYTPPSTLYVGLFTTLPGDDAAGGVEVSGGSYARVSVANNLTQWPSAVAGAKSNANAITFPTATGGWGTVLGFGVFDASSGGNLLAFGAITSIAPVASDVVSFLAGDIAINMD